MGEFFQSRETGERKPRSFEQSTCAGSQSNHPEVSETRRQGRGRLDDRAGEGAFGACGSGPNILILRYRHPAHAQNIVVSVRSNHPELTQVCRVLSTFSPRSQLTRDSKVCRVLSTFSPSSGGSSASNLLEPSRTTSSTPNSCKLYTPCYLCHVDPTPQV